MLCKFGGDGAKSALECIVKYPAKIVPGMLFISANISNFICPSPMDCHNDAGMRVWGLGWHCAKSATLSLSKCMPGMQGDCFAKCEPENAVYLCEYFQLYLSVSYGLSQ
jgi:hypothetical protein